MVVCMDCSVGRHLLRSSFLEGALRPRCRKLATWVAQHYEGKFWLRLVPWAPKTGNEATSRMFISDAKNQNEGHMRMFPGPTTGIAMVVAFAKVLDHFTI